MFTRTISCLLVSLTAVAALVVVGSFVTAEEPPAMPAMPAPPAESAQFARLKTLVGTWEGTAPHGESGEPEQMVVTYALTSGGSALVETEFCGTDKEMITLYYMDGDDLMLTHYCMLGNQPRMIAQESDDPDAISFKFVDGANITTGLEMHMHETIHTFIDQDHIQSRWTMFVGGESSNFTAVLDLHRKAIDAQ